MMSRKIPQCSLLIDDDIFLLTKKVSPKNNFRSIQPIIVSYNVRRERDFSKETLSLREYRKIYR